MTNGTWSDGYAYCVQLIKVLQPPNVTYAKTNYDTHIHLPSLQKDGYIVNVPIPQSWGVDGPSTAQTDFPWAYHTEAFTLATANSGMMAVPPANSIPDANQDLQSFYADNPNSYIFVGPLVSDVLIEMNTNFQFITHLVWHPDGGIPVSMSSFPWSIDCNEYNAIADANPTVQNSLRTPTNGDLTKTFQTLEVTSFVPSLLKWDFNRADYKKNVTPGLWVPRPKKAGGGGGNLSPMGTGPMGSAVTVPNFGNAALLPRGTATGVGVMNGV